MKRNRVRLTESQLHNVIKESVKQVLSEVDWKTFENAEAEAMQKYLETNDDKYSKLAYKFGKARDKAFNDEFGFSDDDYEYGLMGDISSHDPMRYVVDKRNDYPYPSGVNRKYFRYDPYRNSGEHFYRNEDLTNAIQRGDEELRNFYDGNYEYDPIPEKGGTGKGWRLKH